MIRMAEELSDFIEAAGLLKYEPEAISEIYKGHPIRLFKRIWQTLLPIGLFFLKVGLDKITGNLKDANQSKARAKEFTDLLIELGPAFIKAGQALSTRPDIVPQTALEELAQLQDQLEGFDSDLALACIQEDLKVNVNEIFEYLSKEPISAASLGQVHKGKLKTGEKVAVKIQRPGLREQITLDLYIVRNIAKWMKNNISFIRSDLVALIDELGTRVFEEMDYINEADNADKFRSLHEHNTKIAVPKVFRHATSRRVLTMEWIDGVKLTNLKKVAELGINPDEMVEIGVNCSLQQLLEHGFFHADPHPGNLLALKDGRLCYLDFGMMSEVSRQSRTGLIQAVVHLVNRNFDKLSEDFVKLGFLAESVNLEPIVPAFDKVFTNGLEGGVNKMDFKSVTDDISGIMYQFPFRIPPYYALIIRSLITLEGIALSVDPDFKILGAAYPYFARRLMEDNDPQLRQSLKEMLLDGEIFRWSRLEDLLQSATNQQELNIDLLIDQVLDFLFSENGGMLRNELVEAIISRMDKMGWNTVQKINKKLPQKIRSKRIQMKKVEIEANNLYIEEIEPIKQLLKIVQNIPGFKVEIILKRLPRLVIENESRKMGMKVAKGLTEKIIIRLVKLAAKVPQ